VYELISDLRPYFFSLREIEKNVSLDLKIPTNWRLEHIQEVVSQYKSMGYKVQDKNDKFQLVSLIATATQEGYNTARSCAIEIIKHNIELEEKEKLFKEKQRQLQEEYQNKIRDLQDQFKNEPLDKLKGINIQKEDGEKDTTGIELAEQGDGEGSDGD
jgi:hypothetical protein